MASVWVLLLLLLLMAVAADLAAPAQHEVSRAGSSEGQEGTVAPWPGQRHARSLEGGVAAPWLTAGQDEDVMQTESGAGAGAGHGGTTFWVARGKKSREGSPYFYWGPNQSLWGEAFYRGGPAPSGARQAPLPPRSGWESNPNLWGKRDGRGPFWAARGKKDPFWVSRGRRDYADEPLQQWVAEQLPPQEQQTERPWTSEIKRVEGGPFWISRGKRPHPAPAPFHLPSLWSIRGRKSGADNTFWVARGKKETDSRDPFWVARGRRSGSVGGAGTYWIARGKKGDDSTPAGPYWIARGKKADEDSVFWAARDKKDPPAWEAGRRLREDATHSFWIARGKRNDPVTPHTPEKGDDDDDEQYEEATQKAANHYL